MLFSIGAFSQKSIFSYKYTIAGNPFGVEAHYFIPKTKWGVVFSFDRRENNNLIYGPRVIGRGQNVAPQNSEAMNMTNITTHIYRADQFNIGAAYKLGSRIFAQLTVGRYFEQSFIIGEYKYNRQLVFFNAPQKRVNIGVGISYMPIKWVRIGVGYDAAPKKANVSLGFVLP